MSSLSVIRKNDKVYTRVVTNEEMARNRDSYYFNGLRTKVFERDGYKCVSCGMTNEEHKSKWNTELTIDHIDGKGRLVKDKQSKNSSIDNLQTLCYRCHGRKDGRGGISYKGLPVPRMSNDYIAECGHCRSIYAKQLRHAGLTYGEIEEIIPFKYKSSLGYALRQTLERGHITHAVALKHLQQGGQKGKE